MARIQPSEATQSLEEVAPAFTFPTTGDLNTLATILPGPSQVPRIVFRHFPVFYGFIYVAT
jgi:hypothetical protein